MNKSKINIRRAPYALMLCALLSGCSDDKYDINLDPIEEPMDVAMAEYVNSFDVLKNYIDFDSQPNFHLGAAVSSGELMKRGAAGIILHSNFNETMPDDNIMTMGACLGNGGEFDFGNVESYLQHTKEYGLSTFGRSLVWYRSQNADYLNQLIAPVIIEDPSESNKPGHCIIGVCKNAANIWDAQVCYVHHECLKQGVKYTLSFMAKASTPMNPEIWLEGGETQYYGSFGVGTSWAQVNFSFTSQHAEGNKIGINFGNTAGLIYIDDISLVEEGSNINLIANGDFEQPLASCWQAWNPDFFHWSEDTDGYSESAGDIGATNTGYCIVFENATAGSVPWDAQVWYEHYTNFEAGATYNLRFMARATGVWSPEIYLQGGDQQYPGPFTVTTEWQEVNYSFTSSHGEANKIALNFGQYAGKMYIDNISLKKEGYDDELMKNGDFENASVDQWHAWNGDLYHLSTDSEGYSEVGSGSAIIEKTPEEKAEILSGVMNQWISGVLAVTDGQVSDWVIVEDPMSDTTPSELRKVDDDAQNAAGSFLWSDYLGENYVRDAVRMAREHAGDNLKLFVSEYGLEATGNKKCQGLISQIEKWESDGVTKIDGIDVKLELTCSTDPITQKGNEDAIEQMFELLATTGKIIRISHLSVSMANATSTNTDIELAKGNYYNFVLRKYLELIPADLRYGVSFGIPAGLNGIWDSNYNRKASYIGVANGLAGKTNQ